MPSYYSCKTNLLRDLVNEVQLSTNKLCKEWRLFSCTIVADGWTDTCNQTLINFLAYCPGGIILIKFVDAFNIVKSIDNLFRLFKENIYGFFLSPCATHCLNLMLKEIVEIDYIEDVIQCASKITKFLYNHTFVLSKLRKRIGWIETVCLGATHFATSFIALDSILKHMHDL
uniref:DUF659 domain-containing protein n=1 Tax=Nelumbo nucifera TaxID=4432 RepID=A0A822ZFJ0_NELNU|nr:TPA_asm: hypothetical protein HUJ06_002122 [Nelumbo nucifera]